MSNVDQALDDIIKQTKKSQRGARGKFRGTARGNVRGASRGGVIRGASRGTFKARGAFRGASRGTFRGTNRGAFRGASRGAFRGASRGTFRGTSRGAFRGTSRGAFRGTTRGAFSTFRGASRGAGIQTMKTQPGSNKLTISNLEFGVNDNDIKELFQEFGGIRNAAIHYDSSGKSLGKAHVTFTNGDAALKAQKKYNGVHLDGRPMKIAIEGQNISGVVQAAGQRGAFRGVANSRRPVKRLGVPNTFRGASGNFRGTGARGNFRARGSFRGGRGRGGRGARGGARGGRGGRGGRTPKPAPNVADLDAELEAYANQVSK